MIIGIGNDLVEIVRIERLLQRFGQRFINRVFTAAEQEGIRGPAAGHYAKRFAAKEALAKAMGSGIAHGLYLRDIVVMRDRKGKPHIELYGGALARLDRLTPEGKKPVIHVSLSDEQAYAQSFVIIEAL